MDTRWLKQNMFIVAFGVAFIAVIGYVGWQLWGQYGVYQQTQASLDEKLAQLELLQNNDPTPTPENVKSADENHKRLQEAQHNLVQLAIRSSATPVPKFATNIEFAQHLRKQIAHMEKSVQDAKVVVPKGFAFGFKRYTTAVPDRRLPLLLLERMAKQLVVVQRLTALMLKSGVEEIEAIKRVEIEPLPATASLGEDALPDTVTVHPQEHHISMPFELHFACGATNLQTMLNSIATSDRLFIIRFVTIEQEILQKKTGAPDAGPPVPGLNEGGTAGGGTPAEMRSTESSIPDRPPRLRVKVRLEFVELLPPKVAERMALRETMTRNR